MKQLFDLTIGLVLLSILWFPLLLVALLVRATLGDVGIEFVGSPTDPPGLRLKLAGDK